MGLIYPENEDRSARVNDLVNDIKAMQSTTQSQLANINTQNANVLSVMNNAAMAQGESSVDDIISKTQAALPESTLAEYAQKRDALTSIDEALDVPIKISDALQLVASVGGQMRTVSNAPKYYATLTGWVNAICRQEEAEKANAIIKGFSELNQYDRMLNQLDRMKFDPSSSLPGEAGADIGAEAVVGAEAAAVDGGETLSVTSKWAKFTDIAETVGKASKIIGVVGAVLDVVMAPMEFFEASQEKAALVQQIHDLVIARFHIKRFEILAEVAFEAANYALAVAEVQSTMQGLVADGTITQDELTTATNEQLNSLADTLTNGSSRVSDSDILSILKDRDTRGSSYTEDDPSASEITAA
ncbi:hypothetical protein B0H10DRAFT_2184472 [Mycena sp. CBHHK59/15]|nr:hypothetical protein B0H10DRAFT_2184472 [Mycena sp. CBHHK59/15]